MFGHTLPQPDAKAAKQMSTSTERARTVPPTAERACCPTLLGCRRQARLRVAGSNTPMGSEKQFSLAVVKGAGKGQVLRTERKRISVGSSRDNDLVLADPDILERHFMVLIDQGQHRWRIHTFSDDNSITVDRRWSHPTSGERGAL